MGSRYYVEYQSDVRAQREWVVIDSALDKEVCACWTRENALEIVDGLELLDEEYEV